MRTVLNVCLLLSITIATGSCLVCQTCKNYTGDACTEPTTKTCDPSVTRCLTTLTVMQIGEKLYPMVEKSCATSPQLCELAYNMSSGIELYSVSKCCQGDLCNKGSIKLPPINSTENRVQCPACYAKAKTCTPTGTIKCRGSQTKCFNFSGGIYNGTQFEDWAFQGCTTENICEYPAPTYPENYLQEGYKLTCSDSKP
ncbi:phospholipase A2 inhibitor and Ly6/PLAUR domain-containing protein-like [Bufo gargarizans]|uniref:phospholipase A2 inhibitor and Ly6/PLAUR domain-containing protein-like n=1 Tax=Bufo gargarizans TaxID=30331 RepID=UPI001CF231D0|nr:phospholipase A2 inhibitor and Ly6/PLAUR domain-containing protein-like [Bufo gargarizans]